MKLVMQPKDSRLCGQACIAMLTNSPLEDVIGMIGQTLTTWNELYSALFQFGITCVPDLEPAFGAFDLPDLAILLCPAGGGMKHAVLYDRGMIYDPGMGVYPAGAVDWAHSPAHRIIKFSAITTLPIT